jgi:hypothetical protein
MQATNDRSMSRSMSEGTLIDLPFHKHTSTGTVPGPPGMATPGKTGLSVTGTKTGTSGAKLTAPLVDLLRSNIVLARNMRNHRARHRGLPQDQRLFFVRAAPIAFSLADNFIPSQMNNF